MLFYKVKGITDATEYGEGDRHVIRESKRRIENKCKEFNAENGAGEFYFVSDIDDGTVTAGIITEDNNGAKLKFESFLKYTGLQMREITVEETTVGGIAGLLDTACRSCYIENDDDILERFSLDKITGSRYITFGDNVIDECGKEKIYSTANKYLMNETLIPELDRIYAPGKGKKAYGNPVHYMIETDDLDTRREIHRLLLRALYGNNRLTSKRYSYMDFRPGERIIEQTYETLYKVSSGGAVIVRYKANDNSEDNEYVSGEADTIECICRYAKQYCNSVLTIICLPRECTKAKRIFYENLSTLSIVELFEAFATDEKAEDFLKVQAKNAGVRTDKKLFEKIEKGKGYLANDLHALFDEWYNEKLKTTIFPQYKEIATVKKDTVKAAPKGSAYDELQKMIGLTEAKNVIAKALNYYKMQKLYAEKGLNQDKPAMHMVFTGNPGTAKTTAARLFARIMKDNGLLSKGQMIEVGRSDLVGKYVGWTAPAVKAKFNAALGGVLFIDEAYSLVDDRDGLYGDEAINTIVQEMENHRDDVVVIFAGYPDKMETFLQKNPGLRSRIAFHVPFADYTSSELCDIAELMAAKKGLSFADGVPEKLKTVFEAARKQSDFGNGRYVRNILEQARMSQATRLIKEDLDSITTEDLATITKEDIIIPQAEIKNNRCIGF